MLITGSNFFPESKVIFLEKGPDGRPQWEVEAKIMSEKTQGSCILVEVPPYHSKTASSAVQVQFYVCNGKRKRSQSQRFTYLPVLVKQELREDLEHPVAVPLTMPLAHSATLVRTQLPSPEHGPHRTTFCPARLMVWLQALDRACSSHTPMSPTEFFFFPTPASPSGPQFAAAAHRLPHVVSAQFWSSPLPAPLRPSYGPMHSHAHAPGLAFNGQSSLTTQGYERLPFQQSTNTDLHSVSLGMGYSSSSCSSPSAPPPSSPLAGSPQSQSLLGLHILGGYHCGPNSTQASSPTAHPLLSQHSSHCSGQLRITLSFITSAALSSLPVPSSSSPTSGGSPLGTLQQPSGQLSPQSTSPVMASLSPPVGPLGQYPTDADTLNIKQEPVDREPAFRTIGLQDITLDDVNEIIGRDMSQRPAAAHNQS
ncbi:hypothetical protein WMY93_013870 [Mugilogobius chulae]|uniref:Rel homology dimerisation domain-containing protein n=1 Tax=Mugilogobius chulae TaxID=88201 RepID=A0AAW0PCJ1_9GOBI